MFFLRSVTILHLKLTFPYLYYLFPHILITLAGVGSDQSANCLGQRDFFFLNSIMNLRKRVADRLKVGLVSLMSVCCAVMSALLNSIFAPSNCRPVLPQSIRELTPPYLGMTEFFSALPTWSPRRPLSVSVWTLVGLRPDLKRSPWRPRLCLADYLRYLALTHSPQAYCALSPVVLLPYLCKMMAFLPVLAGLCCLKCHFSVIRRRFCLGYAKKVVFL